MLLSNNHRRAVADRGELVWCIRLYLRDIFDTTPMGEVSEIESFLRFDGVPELSVTSRSSIFKYFRATAGVGPYSKAFFRYLFAHSYSRASTEVLFLITFRDSPSTV